MSMIMILKKDFFKEDDKNDIRTWNNINLFELGIFQVGHWCHDSE